MYTPELMVLLSHDLRTGQATVDRAPLMVACQGALIGDLLHEEVVRIDNGGRFSRPKLAVKSPDRIPVHHAAVEAIRRYNGQPLIRALTPVRFPAIDRSVFVLYRCVLATLYERRIIHGADGPNFWFAHEADWPPLFSADVTGTRAELDRVLQNNEPPGTVVRTLLFSLHACGLAERVFGTDTETGRRVAHRCRHLFSSADMTAVERQLYRQMARATKRFTLWTVLT